MIIGMSLTSACVWVADICVLLRYLGYLNLGYSSCQIITSEISEHVGQPNNYLQRILLLVTDNLSYCTSFSIASIIIVCSNVWQGIYVMFGLVLEI